MSKGIILLILSAIIYALARLLFNFSDINSGDYRGFVINLITEIVGIIIVIIIVDFFISIERKRKWKKINREFSKSFKLKIQQNILTTLNQFQFIDFYKSSIQDLPKMNNLIEDFLNNNFDEFFSKKFEKIDNNREFIMHLMAWFTNCNDGLIKTLYNIKPNANPEIIKNLKSFKSYTWFVHRSIQQENKISLPNLDNGIIPEEAKGRQPDLKITYSENNDLDSLKKKIREILEYMIILHNLAEKNKLFYIVE